MTPHALRSAQFAKPPEPMRFCFPTTFYPPYSFGGDAIAVQRLARALVRRGHDVTVVHDADAYEALRNGGTGQQAVAAPSDGVEVITLRSGVGGLSSLLTHQTAHPLVNRSRLKEILGDGRFDVINFHNVSLLGGPGLFAMGKGATKVYTAHEHWLVCPTHVLWRHNREPCDNRQCVRCQIVYRRPPQLWRHGSILQESLEHIHRFVALSEFSREKHREFGFPRGMSVLPPFVEDDDLATETAPRPHARPYFLIVGRLERLKGVHDAIAAFAQYEDADLLIAGEGNAESELRAAAATNPRCIFLGKLSPETLRDYYRHAVATVVPSVGFETFGLVIVESFRERTPVIGRRIGPFPETIQSSGGGELFETASEMVQSARRIQSDPAYRRRLGDAGYAAYRERWSESKVVPRYLELVADARKARK